MQLSGNNLYEIFIKKMPPNPPLSSIIKVEVAMKRKRETGPNEVERRLIL
ncbi:hypothetical protein [Virgibacillus sp. DJP39]